VEPIAQAGDGVGLVVFAHGSSVADANEAVRRVASETARRCGFPLWEPAFLEQAEPNLVAAVGLLAARGAKKIVVAPYFLTMGIHLRRDLPLIVEEASRAHPGIEVACSAPLDGHPALVEILAARVKQALAP